MERFIYINEDFKSQCEKVVKGTSRFAVPQKSGYRNYLQLIRHRLGISRIELARLIQFPLQKIINIESGHAVLSDSDLHEIVRKLGLGITFASPDEDDTTEDLLS